MVLGEQRNVALMKLVQKFSKSGGLKLDTFLKTLSRAKAYLFMERHDQFERGDIYCGCVEMSMARIMEIYTSQLLDGKSDLQGEEKLRDPVLVYLTGVKNGRLEQ